jgi:hypothetical protein
VIDEVSLPCARESDEIGLRICAIFCRCFNVIWSEEEAI